MDANADPAIRNIRLQEGMRFRLDSSFFEPGALFTLTAGCSAILGGKPVRCAGFLPGVSLLVHVLRPANPDGLDVQMSSLWSQAQLPIKDWIEFAEQLPCLSIPVDGARITLALDRLLTLDTGVVQFDATPSVAGRKADAPCSQQRLLEKAMRKVIRLNDPTSHGGKVTSVAATHFTVGGIAVARVGDKITCPLHGDGKITEGDKRHTIDGVAVAYEGHKTSCGAALQSTITNFGTV